MLRGEFIAGLSGAALWPIAASPQQLTVPIIGYVSADRTKEVVAGFHQGLSETGFAAVRPW
jgi:hypothetical protein